MGGGGDLPVAARHAVAPATRAGFAGPAPEPNTAGGVREGGLPPSRSRASVRY
jgi:hypothetical protein